MPRFLPSVLLSVDFLSKKGFVIFSVLVLASSRAGLLDA
jgi:hypothetical protein